MIVHAVPLGSFKGDGSEIRDAYRLMPTLASGSGMAELGGDKPWTGNEDSLPSVIQAFNHCVSIF